MTGVPPQDDDPQAETLRRIERVTEARIRELAEAGELSGLSGEGLPFRREELDGDDGTWAAFHLMRNNRVIPVWSQERIDIDAQLERLRARCRTHRTWLAARAEHVRTRPADRMVEAARLTSRGNERFLTEIESAVRDLNVRIDRYNAIVPSPSLLLLPVSAGGLLASGS